MSYWHRLRRQLEVLLKHACAATDVFIWQPVGPCKRRKAAGSPGQPPLGRRTGISFQVSFIFISFVTSLTLFFQVHVCSWKKLRVIEFQARGLCYVPRYNVLGHWRVLCDGERKDCALCASCLQPLSTKQIPTQVVLGCRTLRCCPQSSAGQAYPRVSSTKSSARCGKTTQVVSNVLQRICLHTLLSTLPLSQQCCL